MATETALNASGVSFSFQLPLAPGQANSAASRPVVLSTEQEAILGQQAAYLSTLAEAGPANDDPDTLNPVKTGYHALTSLTSGTNVASGDLVNANGSIDGSAFVRPVPFGDIVSNCIGITDGSSTSIIAAQGAGIKVYVHSVIIANSSATAVTVDLRDGTGGTVKATFPVPAGAGVVFNFNDAPLPFSANTAVAADPSAAASTVTVTLVGRTSKI